MSEKERRELALSMLLDVVKALEESGAEVELTVVLSEVDEDEVEEVKERLEGMNLSWKVETDPRDLNEVVNDRLEEKVAVIVSDLPLLNGTVLTKFFGVKADVVLAPGRRGGTNMMLVRRLSRGFRASYHYGSFAKHLSLAKVAGLKVEVFDSFFAGCDVDTPDDLLDVMLYAPNSETGRCLRRMGFRVALEKNPRLYRLRVRQ